MSRCGQRTHYVKGCRCDTCRQANREYNRNRERHLRRVAYGIEAPIVIYVDATEAREHLLWLSSVGVGRRTVHEHAGVSISQIAKIAQGKTRKVHPETADRILAIGAHKRPGAALIDPTRARNQVADIKRKGWSNRAINLRINGRDSYHNPVAFETITVARARAIDALWQEVMASDIARRTVWREEKAKYRKAEA